MSARNACRTFRPLRAGVQIRNGAAEAPGTLGLIATDNGGQLWIVSCYHVLARAPDSRDAPVQDGEVILQPNPPFGTPVARLDVGRARADLDGAAALIDSSILAVPEVLLLGTVRDPVDPRAGMRVVKCGASTGVTEGIIDGDGLPGEVYVRVPDRYPSDFELSGPSDSGAVWFERETLAPVALHQAGGTQQGRQFARARPILNVLDALDLRVYLGR